jgi:hypothetical protein
LHGFNPHSFRHALAALGERTCRNPEELKAWSQNLGHEDVLTAFSSYGPVSEQRQAELIKYLALRPTSPDAASALEGKIEEIIKLRKQDQEERDEREGLLDLYMRAMEQAGPEKVAKAA